MKVKLAYGEEGLWVELPDRNVMVVEPSHVPGVSAEDEAIREALRAPLGTPPLAGLVDENDTVAIVFSDLTRPQPREIMLSVLLTTKNHLIGVETVAIGSLNSTCLVPREVFKGAILANAASIILCHNHPSGDLTPSKEDIHMTEEMMKAGKLLGIKLLDHIIVSNQGYVTIHDYHNFTI